MKFPPAAAGGNFQAFPRGTIAYFIASAAAMLTQVTTFRAGGIGRLPEAR